ncbi:hypothetical protein BCR44DRAFT_33655 [Catenaria anguillulae PL171]|uniref:Uncharacterized protein n=1 Tax=Catenaria anguillulae PL171 TaxID=765915 RepID=A0A1Y2I0W0_9FUNG|nr:hypothetical protein BCR44DRAFT_33655 [Catenaria anguillulae PL171]
MYAPLYRLNLVITVIVREVRMRRADVVALYSAIRGDRPPSPKCAGCTSLAIACD